MGTSSVITPKVSLAQTRPNYVDLSPYQTTIKNQGSRTTCITFSAIAALEAAYKRAGYGDLDLSEQFLNHIGKTFWLHPRWNEILAKGEDGSETQVGAFGGGGGVGYIENLARGFKVPVESLMPYRLTEYTSADHPHLFYAWNSTFWNKQRRMSDFNLDPRFLPLAALNANKYYTAQSFKRINPKSVIEIESALAQGKEVVWDTILANTASPIWQPCSPGQANCPNGAHSMLIIGYDRRDPDPTKHYFLVKNSWGGGYTKISYGYLQYGYDAGYIEAIKPPQRWYELAFVGRWDMNFDGWKGTLDIYHLPGYAQWIFSKFGVTTIDRRIGTFYDTTGKAFKVNGSITGQTIRFYIDGKNPNARWDQIGNDREFSYTMVDNSGTLMAGSHKDPDGRLYGGYAKKQGLLSSMAQTPRPIQARSYLASWNTRFNNVQGTLTLSRMDNSFLSLTESSQYSGLVGTFQIGTTTYPAQALVSTVNPNEIRIRIRAILGNPESTLESGDGQLLGRHLNHERGVVAGSANYTNGIVSGFVMVRN
ncbi:C1 family peptidase [Nostoc parmelioides]|uniref:C1 family peptidase n=1 Tax=Nostoc parmelioides FACHB-3921 TaxID=2692909 RepID=A0ABR8BE47_9NOSO|nr:C1 family peptidase [Nostoc parmelioides]MBD2252373.1 C1 family peptidase [Nostoc parmelioides FACHB-3921]